MTRSLATTAPSPAPTDRAGRAGRVAHPSLPLPPLPRSRALDDRPMGATGRIDVGTYASLPVPRLQPAPPAQDDLVHVDVDARVEDRTQGEETAPAAPNARPRRRHRLLQPPGRRAPLWLAALILGALLAAHPAAGGSASPVSISAAEYGLGDSGAGDGTFEADVRASITEAEAQARLQELAASRASREPKVILPTNGRFTSSFGARWGTKHYGIDLAGPLGTPIVSATDGVVLRAGAASGYGNAIYIQDPDGDVLIYGHMRYYNVKAGQIVHAGDPIAKVGEEGYSTGPHLHFEIHQGGMNGKPTDPQKWLAARGIHVG